MNNEIEELAIRLNDLIALSKKKKYQLAKPEKDEAFKVLSSLINLDLGGYNLVMNSLFKLPSDIGANLLYDNWANLNEHHDSIFYILQEEKYNSDLGKRLRLVLARKVLENEPKAALRILQNVLLSMRSSKQYFPTSDDLKLINSTLLKKGSESLSILPLHECGIVHRTLILNYMLGATFLPKHKDKLITTFETQAFILKWVNTISELDQLPSELHIAIPQCIRKWDNNQKEIMKSQLDSFHPVLKDILEQSLSGYTEPEDKKQTSAISISPIAGKQQSTIGDAPKEPDILDGLNRVSNQVRGLMSELQKAKSDVAQVDINLKNVQSELESLQIEHAEWKRIIETEQERVKHLTQENSKLIEERSRLKEDLHNEQSKLANARESHEKELDDASERIDRESEHKVKVFCNRLAYQLRDNVKNLKDAEDMDMTLELGEALKTQLRQVLKILEKEGINGGT